MRVASYLHSVYQEPVMGLSVLCLVLFNTQINLMRLVLFPYFTGKETKVQGG
jgi:hypothetical protein